MVGSQSFCHCDWWWDTRCKRLRSADVEDMFTVEVNNCYCADSIVFEEVLIAQCIKEMRPPATA
jgi:hypothetical protein